MGNIKKHVHNKSGELYYISSSSAHATVYFFIPRDIKSKKEYYYTSKAIYLCANRQNKYTTYIIENMKILKASETVISGFTLDKNLQLYDKLLDISYIKDFIKDGN